MSDGLNEIEHVAVFEGARGRGLIQAERFVREWPALFGAALKETRFALSVRRARLFALARFDADAYHPGLEARFTFWAERSGGNALALGELDLLSRANLLARFEQCEHHAETFEQVLSGAGVQRDRAEPLGLEIDLNDAGAFRWDPTKGRLLARADRFLPVGDRVRLTVLVPGTAEAFAAEGKVGYSRHCVAIGLVDAPPKLKDALTHVPANLTPATPMAAPVDAGVVERFEVKFATVEQLVAERATLLAGGLFLPTRRLLPVMTDVQVALELPDGSKHVVGGLVVTTDRSGAGLQLQGDPSGLSVLTAAVLRLAGKPDVSSSRISVLGLVEEPIPEPGDPPLPRIGAYEVLSLLGRGGMAEVFYGRALEGRRAGEAVALKRLTAQMERNPEAVRLFAAEADILARLEHPNIVETFEAGVADGRPFLAMALVDGRDLGQILRRCKQRGVFVPIDVVCFLIKSVLDALQRVHREGVVHCDVSPANVFVSRDGEIKLGDFGLARPAAPGVRGELVGGKASYLSPEALDGEVSVHADLWSTGVMLYEALTLEKPFDGATRDAKLDRITAGKWKAARSLRAEISTGLEDVLTRGFEKKAKKRFQSAAELSAALNPQFNARLGTPLAVAAMVQGLFDEVLPPEGSEAWAD